MFLVFFFVELSNCSDFISFFRLASTATVKVANWMHSWQTLHVHMNFPPHRPPGVKKRREKFTAASRDGTAHPKLLLETAKVAQNLVPFSIVFSVCGKIHWYICFRGLQSTMHIRVSLSLQEYTYEFLGFLLL